MAESRDSSLADSGLHFRNERPRRLGGRQDSRNIWMIDDDTNEGLEQSFVSEPASGRETHTL